MAKLAICGCTTKTTLQGKFAEVLSIENVHSTFML